jgi:N-hydroxyarylamine O-acetyltransferase
MYEQLSTPLTAGQVSGYLDRLGITPSDVPSRPDKVFLDRLIVAQQSTIPFETLDICYTGGLTPCDTATLYDKLITRKRGGYCFELNALFARLLEALGYKTSFYLVRAIIRRDYLAPRLHRANMVELDGQLLLVDVGFGGPCPAGAMPFTQEEYTDPAGQTFKLTPVVATPETANTPAIYTPEQGSDQWLLEREQPEGWQRLLLIDANPQHEVDFVAPNEYSAVSKDSYFVQHRIVYLRKLDSLAHILDDHFKYIEAGELQEELDIASSQQLDELLSEYFDISI